MFVDNTTRYLEDGLMLYFAYDHQLTYVSNAPPGAEAPIVKDNPADYDLTQRFPSQYIAGRSLGPNVRVFEVMKNLKYIFWFVKAYGSSMKMQTRTK